MNRKVIGLAALAALASLCVAQVQAEDETDVRSGLGKDGAVSVMVASDPDAVKAYKGAMVLRTMAQDASQRVDVEIKNEPVREALKTVLGQVKQDYVVDDDVPNDVRITIIAKNVRLRTALSLIAEAAGIGWRKELDGGKTRLRFGKAIKAWDGIGSMLGFSMPEIRSLRDVQVQLEPLREGVVWRALTGTEERSTVVCPHCKAQITRVGPRENPKCPKCSVEFKPGWKVCPFDGTKRPEVQGDWKYCPVCGKSLGEKAKE